MDEKKISFNEMIELLRNSEQHARQMNNHIGWAMRTGCYKSKTLTIIASPDRLEWIVKMT